MNSFQTNMRNLEHILWNYPKVNVTRHHWWLVNIGWGKGLVRQATSHFLSQCWPISRSSYAITRQEWVNVGNIYSMLMGLSIRRQGLGEPIAHDNMSCVDYFACYNPILTWCENWLNFVWLFYVDAEIKMCWPNNIPMVKQLLFTKQ